MRKILNKLFVYILIAFITGCSYFQSTQRLNISEFANSMISVAGEIQYSLLQHKSIHLSQLTPGPAFSKFDLYKKKLRNVITSTISYSIEIVTLVESNTSEESKVSTLADYLEGIKKPVLEHPKIELNISQSRMDEIIINVRKQKKLLDGLSAAQPIIDEVAISTGNLSDELKGYMDDAFVELEDEWRSNYAEVLWANQELKGGQIRAIRGLYHLKNFRTGVTNKIDSVFISDPQLVEVVEDRNDITLTEIMDLEKRLLYKLTQLSDMRKQFEEDIDLYYTGLDELEGAKGAYNTALRDARNAIILWSRAHNSLSKGVTDPAEIDILGMMLNAAKTAVPGM